MDECIAILRGAMTGKYFEYHSENYDFGLMKMFPVPSRPVPILIGGHSKPALTRAARLGDGWIAANTDFETLKSLLRQLDELRRAHGTDGRQGLRDPWLRCRRADSRGLQAPGRARRNRCVRGAVGV